MLASFQTCDILDVSADNQLSRE